jgi:hypothetical protein
MSRHEIYSHDTDINIRAESSHKSKHVAGVFLSDNGSDDDVVLRHRVWVPRIPEELRSVAYAVLAHCLIYYVQI